MKKNLFWTCAVITLLIGIIHASSLSFVNDDAFISFRYAKNLVNGLGLVYNPGERVEGFTNFLWTILIAVGITSGFDPVSFSTSLGIFFYGLTIGLYCLLTWKLSEGTTLLSILFPITAILLAVHRDFNVYATSGLETMMFTFLVSAAFYFLVTKRNNIHFLIAGFFLVLAMMTRPDGVVFLAASIIFLFLTSRSSLKDISIFILPTVVVFIPYWMWRYSYFGFFFPNAFYAKSIGLPYYEQGWKYIAMYFETYYVFALVLILLIFFIGKYKFFTGAGMASNAVWRNELEANNGTRGVLLALLFAGAYLLFIFRIGGDFMFARFLIPITPMLCFLIEQCLHTLPRQTLRHGLTGLSIVAMLFRWDHFREESRIEYIADEWKWYTPEHLEESRIHGELLNKYFQGVPVKVAFWAGQVKLIYYAEPYIAIEASAGLTDTAIAHQPITERGRPGHEKQAPVEYLEQRGVNFFFGPLTPPPPGQQVLNMILFDSIAAKIIAYENTVMDALAKHPTVRFYSFPKYIDSYLERIHLIPRQELMKDYANFKSFYFDHNSDTEREQYFLNRLKDIQGQ